MQKEKFIESLIFTEYGITYPHPKTEGLYVIRYNDDGGTFYAIAKWNNKEKKFFDESDHRRFFSRVAGYKLLKSS